MSFGIPIRNGLSLGLRPVATLATDLSSFDPGPPWIVLTSSGIAYLVYQVVQDSSGTAYTVSFLVKSSNGVDYYIAPYEPSLYLDYTIPSSGVPGVQPGYYLVDDVSGNLTQTTFSSLITFSRASNATRYSPTGQLEYAPHNLLLQSQDFSTTWTNGNTTETTNTAVAPDGTTTADTLDDGTSTATHDIAQNVSITSGTTYTLSAFFKNIDRQYVILACSTGTNSWASAKFDLVAGAVGATSSSGAGWSTTSSSITNVGNGWYRCTITFVPGTTSATGANRIGMATDSTTFTAGLRGLESYTGTNKQIYIWGAQLAVGPNPLDYTPTTTAVVYGPRFDYNPSTLVAQGLLIEEQRTNSLTYSEQFDNAAWSKTASSITANAIASPDGTLTGDKLVEDTATSAHTISQSLSATTQSYTISVYVKKAERKYFQLFGRRDSTNYNGVMIDLDTGSLLPPTRPATTSNVSTTTATSVGNGWWRIAMTYSYTTTGTTVALFALTDDSQTYSYTGDGTSGIYIWGAQLEAGAFATSYIPTTTAATTRSADIASIGTLSPWYNATEGTLFTEGTVVNNISGTTARVFGYFADSGVTNLFSVEARSATSTRARILTGGVTVNASDTIDVLGVNAKLAGAYGSDGATICVNGRSPVTAASSLPTGIAALYLGQNSVPTAASIANGYIRRITYTPRRLTDAELQSLTS
jgi:hypothetical protein